MATGFSLEQLSEMDKLLRENIPRSPKAEDARRAPVPLSIATATVPNSGILVNFGKDPKGKDEIQFLTPIVARQLVCSILLAGQQNEWWDNDLNLRSKDGRLFPVARWQG
jgi:hypothetical protein